MKRVLFCAVMHKKQYASGADGSKEVFVNILQFGKSIRAVALACACVAFALVGLTACGSEEPKEASQPAQEASADVMRIGTLQTEDSLPFWAAEQLGYYQKNNVEVEIITFQSAQELCRFLALCR